jgi:hypothetical protein
MTAHQLRRRNWFGWSDLWIRAYLVAKDSATLFSTAVPSAALPAHLRHTAGFLKNGV